jgi:predicted anti-sigma-YlaC factor YlaD
MSVRFLPPGMARCAVLALALPALAGCGAIRGAAINTVASTLSETGTTFSSDNDPELIRESIPFALKLYESILESTPRHKDLLIATCSAFTQYAYGFLETDAEALGEGKHEEVVALKARALKLYIRGKDYCMRAMDVRWKGVSAAIMRDPAAAIARVNVKRGDVPLLYWTAASLGAAVSLGLDKPELVVDLPTVRALAERALSLDAAWNKGALHELMITIDSLPEAMGGSPARARDHFDKAVKIQGGNSPGPYVALATGVMVPAQDRAGFEKLLNEALAIDPEKDPATRLVTLITQRRARALLDNIDVKFSKY